MALSFRVRGPAGQATVSADPSTPVPALLAALATATGLALPLDLLAGFPPKPVPLPVEEDATVADLGLAPGEPLTVRAAATAAVAAPVAAAPPPPPPPPPPPVQQQPPQPEPAATWAATYGDDVATDEDAALAAAIAASLEEEDKKGHAGGGGGGGGMAHGDVPAPPPSTSGRPLPRPRHNPTTNRGAPTSVPLPDGTGWLARRVVAADNSCLFASVGLLVQGTRSVAAELREVVAAAVLADPATYHAALLEKAPAEYAAWIRHPSTWGGAVELSILAAWAGVELAAGDIATQRVDVYGSGRGFATRGWLVYDGLHYDAVCVVPGVAAPVLSTRRNQGGAGEERDVRTLAVGSSAAAAATTAFTTLLAGFQAARAFTDTARFTLRCGVCGVGVAGEKEAVAHAKETGHGNFQEY